VPTALKSGSLNLLEPSGPVKACNGVALLCFGPKRDKVTRDWRKLHNEELNNLKCSPNIFWVMKFIRMRWAGHVARMGEEGHIQSFLVVNLRERNQLGHPGIEEFGDFFG
jgi:hypothetical protein